MTELIEVEFVNRDAELNYLRKMRTDPQAARILLIKAPTGMGKSWLLSRARHEHGNLPVGFVHLGQHFALDPIALIRSLSEQMPETNWEAVDKILEQLGKNYTITLQREGQAHPPASIEFGDHTRIDGDVVGGDKIIFSADEPLVREQLTAELSQAFMTVLGSFQPCEPALILFDAYEQRTLDVEKWLLEMFLPHIRVGTLRGVLVVIAGRDVPQFDRNWRLVVVSTELAGIPTTAIREYWVKRRKLPEEEVAYAIKFSGGSPQLMALMADNSTSSSMANLR
jgi:hypothetical protein